MRDKYGNYLTVKEYFKRWGEGIQKVTPLQQTVIQRNGVVLVLIGVVIGLCSTFATGTWWLFIILCGSLFLTIVNFIGIAQRLKVLRDVEKKYGYLNLEGGKNEK